MRLFFLTIGLIFTLTACQSDETETLNTGLINTHKVVVSEVLQTTNYTYLYVDENGEKVWLAVPKMTANKGDVYYYDGGMLMENFESKELKRTFDKIFFLDAVRTTPEPVKESLQNTNPHNSTTHNEKPVIGKKDIQVSGIEGGISISELFSEKEKYNGKTVKIKGVVAKFSPQIMKKNWIHLQDGTDFNGEFDLTITSQAVVKTGDTIVVEGKIALDKDFGYGYFYKIIMEDASVK
ncbi:MAG: GW dipeptide domain-containing protein [Bacteroidales bacterium]|nr:GW dipeptide domain-containing protein [Bacteroidales bacterium]